MYRAAQTTTLLGGRGEKGEKERQIVLIVLRLLSPIVAWTSLREVQNLILGRGFAKPAPLLSMV